MEHLERERLVTGNRFGISEFIGVWESHKTWPMFPSIADEQDTKDLMERDQ